MWRGDIAFSIKNYLRGEVAESVKVSHACSCNNLSGAHLLVCALEVVIIVEKYLE
jgi:hypothetical protein